MRRLCCKWPMINLAVFAKKCVLWWIKTLWSVCVVSYERIYQPGVREETHVGSKWQTVSPDEPNSNETMRLRGGAFMESCPSPSQHISATIYNTCWCWQVIPELWIQWCNSVSRVEDTKGCPGFMWTGLYTFLSYDIIGETCWMHTAYAAVHLLLFSLAAHTLYTSQTWFISSTKETTDSFSSLKFSRSSLIFPF